MCLTHRPREGYYALPMVGLGKLVKPVITLKTFVLISNRQRNFLATEVLGTVVDLVRKDGLLFANGDCVRPTIQQLDYVFPVRARRIEMQTVSKRAKMAAHTRLFHSRLTARHVMIAHIDSITDIVTVPVVVPHDSIVAVGTVDIVSTSYALFTKATIDLFNDAAKAARMRKDVRATLASNALYVEKQLGV